MCSRGPAVFRICPNDSNANSIRHLRLLHLPAHISREPAQDAIPEFIAAVWKFKRDSREFISGMLHVMIDTLNLQGILSFVHSVQSGSFTQAAQRLGVTASAVGQGRCTNGNPVRGTAAEPHDPESRTHR
jgi:hypothetical protein